MNHLEQVSSITRLRSDKDGVKLDAFNKLNDKNRNAFLLDEITRDQYHETFCLLWRAQFGDVYPNEVRS